jgi:hypothetical protein
MEPRPEEPSVKTAALALVCAAALAASDRGAVAAPSTPFGGEGFAAVVEALDDLKASRPEAAAAIDAAIARFSDASSGYSEDLKDFRKALKVLRPLVTGDGDLLGTLLDSQRQIALFQVLAMNQRLLAGDPLGTARRVIAIGRVAGVEDEQKYYAKLAKQMAKVQAAARKRGVNLYS